MRLAWLPVWLASLIVAWVFTEKKMLRPGRNNPGDNYPGGNSPGGNYPGAIVLGGNFPDTIRTIWKIKFLISSM